MTQTAFRLVLSQICRPSNVKCHCAKAISKERYPHPASVVSGSAQRPLPVSLLSSHAREYIADAMSLLLAVPIICKLSLWLAKSIQKNSYYAHTLKLALLSVTFSLCCFHTFSYFFASLFNIICLTIYWVKHKFKFPNPLYYFYTHFLSSHIFMFYSFYH